MFCRDKRMSLVIGLFVAVIALGVACKPRRGTQEAATKPSLWKRGERVFAYLASWVCSILRVKWPINGATPTR